MGCTLNVTGVTDSMFDDRSNSRGGLLNVNLEMLSYEPHTQACALCKTELR